MARYPMMVFLIFGISLLHHSNSQQLFGVQSLGRDLRSHTQLLQQLGVQIVRLPFSWRLLEERGKNIFSPGYLEYLDTSVLAMEQAGIKIIFQMAQVPCWASSSSDCTKFLYRPKNYNDYADAMAFLLRRYGNRVYAWEIWNEPNLIGGWLRPECQANNGMCPRAANMNDEFMEFTDLVGAREYSDMVKITYQKMKSIDSNVIILAGSLASGDVYYLNEMYRSGIKNYFTGLAMHPYTAVYPQGHSLYGKEYGPDDCFPPTPTSKFWCFRNGVEQIRAAMVAQMDSSKSIWFTEFGFSSFDGWNGAGLQGQADHLERAIDIIRQWKFVYAACFYELSDRKNVAHREGHFGLFNSNLQIKPSGLVYIRKIKNFNGIISPTTTVTVAVTTPATSTVYPNGLISTQTPHFAWPSVPGANSYLLWVNDYGNPNIGGKINSYYFPTQANCSMNNGGLCKVTPNVRFSKQGGQWWVTAYFINGQTSTIVVNGLLFVIQ